MNSLALTPREQEAKERLINFLARAKSLSREYKQKPDINVLLEIFRDNEAENSNFKRHRWITEEQIQRMLVAKEQGSSYAQIARLIGRSQGAVYQAIRRAERIA